MLLTPGCTRKTFLLSRFLTHRPALPVGTAQLGPTLMPWMEAGTDRSATPQPSIKMQYFRQFLWLSDSGDTQGSSQPQFCS